MENFYTSGHITYYKAICSSYSRDFTRVSFWHVRTQPNGSTHKSKKRRFTKGFPYLYSHLKNDQAKGNLVYNPWKYLQNNMIFPQIKHFTIPNNALFKSSNIYQKINNLGLLLSKYLRLLLWNTDYIDIPKKCQKDTPSIFVILESALYCILT